MAIMCILTKRSVFEEYENSIKRTLRLDGSRREVIWAAFFEDKDNLTSGEGKKYFDVCLLFQMLNFQALSECFKPTEVTPKKLGKVMVEIYDDLTDNVHRPTKFPIGEIPIYEPSIVNATHLCALKASSGSLSVLARTPLSRSVPLNSVVAFFAASFR